MESSDAFTIALHFLMARKDVTGVVQRFPMGPLHGSGPPGVDSWEAVVLVLLACLHPPLRSGLEAALISAYLFLYGWRYKNL